MKTKTIYLKIAGILSLFTALLHTIGGQLTDVNPLLKSNLDNLPKTEILGVWQMVTITLFATSFIWLYFAYNRKEKLNIELLKFISYLYILYGLGFIIISLFQGVFAPQWILLLPNGILGILGIKTKTQNA